MLFARLEAIGSMTETFEKPKDVYVNPNRVTMFALVPGTETTQLELFDGSILLVKALPEAVRMALEF